MSTNNLSTFLNLSEIPTTSFHENLVSDFIKEELNKIGIKFQVDLLLIRKGLYQVLKKKYDQVHFYHL